MADIPSNTPKVDPDEILEGIRTWVEIESPSNDGEAVNRMVDKVESDMRAIGAEIDRTPGRDGFGDIMTARTPGAATVPGSSSSATRTRCTRSACWTTSCGGGAKATACSDPAFTI